MITCAECGRRISNSAKACPGGGASTQSTTSKVVWSIVRIAAVLALLFFIAAVWTASVLNGVK